jgi:hypothetical protein
VLLLIILSADWPHHRFGDRMCHVSHRLDCRRHLEADHVTLLLLNVVDD